MIPHLDLIFEKFKMWNHPCFLGGHLVTEDWFLRLQKHRAKVCRSKLILQQHSVNFGTMHAGDERARVIVMHNQSEAPLAYNIVKSGTINSQNLRVNLKNSSVVRGVVRPYVLTPGQQHDETISSVEMPQYLPDLI
jgi:hypothetical protein